MAKRERREQHEPEDYHIGTRIRRARLAKGLRLEDLADQIGMFSWQQLQKYETGANRVTGGMLYKIAKHLGVQPSYFFAGLPDPITDQPMEAFEAHVLDIARKIDALDPPLMECVSMLISRLHIEKPDV